MRNGDSVCTTKNGEPTYERDSQFHLDRDLKNIPRPYSLAPECEGCSHVLERPYRPGKRCVYVMFPKLRKFPCYFRDNIPPGGFDGQYGATVNNYIKDVRVFTKNSQMLLDQHNEHIVNGEDNTVEEKQNTKTFKTKVTRLSYNRLVLAERQKLLIHITEEEAYAAKDFVVYHSVKKRGETIINFYCKPSEEFLETSNNVFVMTTLDEFNTKIKLENYIEIDYSEAAKIKNCIVYEDNKKNIRRFAISPKVKEEHENNGTRSEQFKELNEGPKKRGRKPKPRY